MGIALLLRFYCGMKTHCDENIPRFVSENCCIAINHGDSDWNQQLNPSWSVPRDRRDWLHQWLITKLSLFPKLITYWLRLWELTASCFMDVFRLSVSLSLISNYSLHLLIFLQFWVCTMEFVDIERIGMLLQQEWKKYYWGPGSGVSV
jgi:hypothetical protein